MEPSADISADESLGISLTPQGGSASDYTDRLRRRQQLPRDEEKGAQV
jgi:hypothetical protein